MYRCLVSAVDNQAVILITKYAEHYRSERFQGVDGDPESLLNHWWHAYRFLTDRIFLQARSDIVSRTIRDMAEDALSTTLDVMDPTALEKANDKLIDSARLAFENMEVDGKSYKKKRDVQMLFGVKAKGKKPGKQGLVQFIRGLPNANIVAHTIQEIKNKRITEHYDTLRSFQGIGHKIASSYLRDVAELFFDHLEEHIRSIDTQMLFQPIDSHVLGIAKEVGIEFYNNKPLHQAMRIAEECLDVSISKRLPLRFSQGASWFGRRCFRVAMDLLKKSS